jgi:voltage-gated potassium channel
MNSRRLKKFTIPTIVILFCILLFAIVLAERNASNGSIKDFFDVVWYAIVTIATVGYGDYYPVTTTGRILGIVLVLFTIGFMGYIIGMITTNINKVMEDTRLGQFGTDFNNHVVIIGWDKFSRQVMQQIVLTKYKVAIVTDNKEDVNLIYELFPKNKVFVLVTEFENPASLEKVNFSKASTCFINFKNDMEALVYVINIKKKYPKIEYVIAVQNADLKQTFRNTGVDHVIARNEVASHLVASYIFEPDVAQFTADLMTTSINEMDYDIQQYLVTENNPFLKRLYIDSYLEFKLKYNAVLIGLSKFRDGNWQLLYNPCKKETIEVNDYLVLIANGIGKKKLEKAFGVIEGKADGHALKER